MRAITGALSFILVCLLVTSSQALTRRAYDHPFFARTAVSGYFGAGLAVGEFASEKDGDGNEESGAFDWSAEIEHFFAPGVSVGFNITHTSYNDKDFGADLKTNLATYGGFLRYVVDTGGPVYPYMRLGVGSMEVEFETTDTRDESDHAGSIHVGGGGIFMLGDFFGLSASALYTFGFTDETAVGDVIVVDNEELLQVVGFDVEYWTFSAGISVYFP